MTVSRLSFYNNALLLCGERALASLSENREPRRLLDQVWDTGGVNKCLESGQWKFAMRTVMLDYDPNVAPSFGYSRAFDKPTDWVNTSGVCTDPYFRTPLLQYVDEAGYWYADLDRIYVRYVSNDDQYGLNLGRWPGSFEDYAAAFFALRIGQKLTGSTDGVKRLQTLHDDLKKIALNKDAMADPTKMLPPGTWSRARLRNTGRDDLGYRTGDLY